MQRADQRPQPALPARYQVRRHLATGGMASVWCADDLLLGRRVAIKILSERFAHDEIAVRRFKREARAAARVSAHPHVVTTFDIGDLEPPPGEPLLGAFIVMEHLAGGTVADALRVGAVRRREAVRWLREAASALDHAHSQGIVHRDIKPANFLLDRSRVLHVADFGIARMASDETITNGELFGTAAYLSPEQALGREATDASDRYALAVAAFELLAGERPFVAEHFAVQARMHIEVPAPRISALDRTLPTTLDDILARGLAKVPQDRFGLATEFVDALETALSGGVLIGGAIPTPTAHRAPAGIRPHGRERPTVATTRRLAGEMAAGAAATAPRASQPSLRQAGPVAPVGLHAGRLAAVAALLIAIGGAGWLTLSGMHGRSTAGTQSATRHRALSEARLHRVTQSTTTARRSHPKAPSQVKSTTSVPSTTQTPQQLQLQGYNEMLAGNYHAAIPTLRRAVSLADKSSLTYAYGLYNLGVSLLKSGDAAAAIPILEQRLQIANQQGQVLQMLDAALRATGKAPVGTNPAGKKPPGHAGKGSSGGAGLGGQGQGDAQGAGRGHGSPGSGGGDGPPSAPSNGPGGAPMHTSLVD